MAYYLKDLPFTEEGKKLNLSDEDRKRFRMVYKRQGEDWILHDIFGEGGEYGDDCIVVPLESTYKGYTVFNPGQNFANVIRSSHDPNPAGSCSWIAFWRCLYVAKYDVAPPERCCTDGFLYTDEANWMDVMFCDGGNRYERNNFLQGGHVILGQHPLEVRQYSMVYIVPICVPHNGTNAGYMKTRENTFAVQLSYRADEAVRFYLAQHPLETHEKI